MSWASSLFSALFMFSCSYFIHLKTGGLMLTTKIVHFVKLSKCETDFTIAFLSSSWSKNISRTSNSESGWRSYAPRKMLRFRQFQLKSEVPTVVGTSGKPEKTYSGAQCCPYIRSSNKCQKFWLSELLTDLIKSPVRIWPFGFRSDLF